MQKQSKTKKQTNQIKNDTWRSAAVILSKSARMSAASLRHPACSSSILTDDRPLCWPPAQHPHPSESSMRNCSGSSSIRTVDRPPCWQPAQSYQCVMCEIKSSLRNYARSSLIVTFDMLQTTVLAPGV
jgi:hypothetical protein